MAIVLVLAGTFVYLRVATDLAGGIDDGLRTRVDDLARVLEGNGLDDAALGTPDAEGGEDALTQIVRPDGEVIGSSEEPPGESVLDPSQLAAANRGLVFFDAGSVPGVEEEARLLARPVESDEGRLIVVAGASTGDRAETLAGLVATFAIGGPIALLLASALGYGLATLAMRPVEAMRQRAEGITLERSGERLPLPPSADEINRLGRTLNEMLERIESSLERERGFVADASHELRTPLAILRSELELGVRPDRSLEEARTAMRSAGEEVERLQQLTDDLLAMARSDGAKLPLNAREVAVGELLERTRARFIERARESGRAIEIDAPASLVANLDPLRMEGALGNLVDNSLRHGDGGIRLGARRIDPATVELRVSDEGAGFLPGFADRAFERFSRAESGRTTPGSGLGLAIVKAIAEAHGGSVAIDPDAPGAAVVMRIPG